MSIHSQQLIRELKKKRLQLRFYIRPNKKKLQSGTLEAKNDDGSNWAFSFTPTFRSSIIEMREKREAADDTTLWKNPRDSFHPNWHKFHRSSCQVKRRTLSHAPPRPNHLSAHRSQNNKKKKKKEKKKPK